MTVVPPVKQEALDISADRSSPYERPQTVSSWAISHTGRGGLMSLIRRLSRCMLVRNIANIGSHDVGENLSCREKEVEHNWKTASVIGHGRDF